MKEEKDDMEMGEDATMYGEFICSMHHWLPPQVQKKQTKKLETMTEIDKTQKNEPKRK